MKDEFLPGLEDHKPRLSEEDEEKRFYRILFSQMSEPEKLKLFPSMVEPSKEKLQELLKIAESYQLELPRNLKRKLKEWTGPDTYEQIKKKQGSKYTFSLVEHIQNVFPLSLKGFDFSYDKRSIKWKRESDEKEFTLCLPIEKKDIMKPASGDFAKRTITAIFKFAVERKTYDPGPILFKDFLDLLGESRASQEKRKRIKDICESCAFTSMTIRKMNEKGKEIYFRHTPFFKDFLWQGGFDYEAIIYPVINERFERMLIEENLSGYVWIDDERLKRLPKGMTDRDRLAQDQFKMIMGFPVIRFIMKNWLYKFGQFTDTEIKKLKLLKIKEFVNKNITLAKEGLLLERVKIHKFQKKERYLRQVIFLYPAKSKWTAKKKIALTKGEQKEVKEITDWLYEIGVEDYANIDLKTIKQYLLNIAEYGYLDCLRTAYEVVEDYAEPGYPVDEKGSYQNRPMEFWLEYKNCRRKNKA